MINFSGKDYRSYIGFGSVLFVVSGTYFDSLYPWLPFGFIKYPIEAILFK